MKTLKEIIGVTKVALLFGEDEESRRNPGFWEKNWFLK